MKISAFTNIVNLKNLVIEKQDGAGQNSKEHTRDDSSHQKEEKQSGDVPKIEVKDGEVQAALEAFRKDSQNNGLAPSLEGSALGLKVILRDGSGAIVRQFSGEEFVKLREAANLDGRSRGKILDQKL